MVKLSQTAILTAFLSLAGCVTYRYNLAHARIDPKAKLSQAEIEQIVRAVTQKSHLMVIAVTRESLDGRDQVLVYTALDDPPLMIYTLEKSSDGLWRIIRSGGGHVMLI